MRVLVTGASKGIGYAIANRLGESGWDVAIHYGTDAEGAQSLERDLGDRYSGAYKADLKNQNEVLGLLDQVEADGPIDALVNNAGVYRPLTWLDASPEDLLLNWRETYAVNLLAPLLLCHRASKLFASRGGGKILNVASRVGFKGESGAATYASTKAALINLTRSLAGELAPYHIGVFGIAPGWVETAMVRTGMADRLPQILDTLPLGRMASVQDCAAAANFLLSDEAAYLSGQVIDINGASYFH